MNISAPIGMRTTYPASEAMLDMMPRKTTTGVMRLRGVTATVRLRIVGM